MIVRVKWIDSETSNGWRFLDDIRKDEEPVTVVTFGYLIKEHPTYLIIAGTISEDCLHGQASGIINIPRCSVLEYEEIEIVNKKD